MRKLLLLLLFISYFLRPDSIKAQGYIDCATILNDDSDWINSNVDVEIVNGYTHIFFTPWHYDPLTAGSLPVINGENWHTGDETDAYLAVIDPACNQIFGTYIGGSGYEGADIMEIDVSGNIIVTGYTDSPDFPTTDGTTLSGTDDNIFIRKYASDGTLVFSTLYGGSDNDQTPHQLVIDGTDIYLGGITRSIDFPTTNGTTLSGSWDHFILKLDGNGVLQYATIHGGSDWENDLEISVTNGQVFLMGSTRSTDYPTTDGSTYAGGLEDGIVTIFDISGNVLFSSVYGGDGRENGFSDYNHIHLDDTYFYVFGMTTSIDFQTTDGSVHNASHDLYFRKYDLVGNLIYSKLYGGNGSDYLEAVELVNGSFYLLGSIYNSTGFPTTDGSTENGSGDALIMKLDTDGNINYATLYGGSSSNRVVGFYPDLSGEVYLNINGTDAPTTDGSSGFGTVFAKFNADGSLCAASTINNDPSGNYGAYSLEVINDTMYTVKHQYSTDAISTDGSVYNGGLYDSENLSVVKFVFCPPTSPIATDDLTPSSMSVCENSLLDQIIGMEHTIDGSIFPQIYTGGVPSNQPDIELSYQWQVSSSAAGPWTDIVGPLAQQQNFAPPPTAVDIYYQRLTKTNECCGGGIVSTSSVTSILMDGNSAPTVDAGGTYYTCPGEAVIIGGSPAATGGTTPYTYNWNNGMYTIENPSVAPTVSSVYTLEVTDPNGCIQVDQATVTVYSANAGENSSVCDGAGTLIGGGALSGVTIVPSGGTPPAGEFSAAYDWIPKDGSLSCTDCPNPIATPGVNTDYTLTVTINRPDGSSCNTSDMVSVDIIATAGNIAISDTVICLGDIIELSTNPSPVTLTTISSISQSSTSTSLATIANLTDGDFSTGGHTNDGNGENITIDLGNVETINNITLAPLTGQTSDDRLFVDISLDNVNWTTNITGESNYNAGPTVGVYATYSFSVQDVRYVRLSTNNTYRDVSISEFSATYDYSYVWTPGDYISTAGASAVFSPGTIDMVSPDPITYTVSAALGSCVFYDQVTVAVIEARAGEDRGCGPTVLGKKDRTPNIDETYTWTKITDPAITTGTGDLIGATDIANPTASASTGGNVGYELTVSYTLGTSTAVCKDTVIVMPGCGASCTVAAFDGGCIDFENGTSGLVATPYDGDASNWTFSWTSNLGMQGLGSYTGELVYLTDNVNRTYTVTMTSILDPSVTCTASIDANSASNSKPTFNAQPSVTTCKDVPVSIGDPANNPGLTYEWSGAANLDDATNSFPEATVSMTTEFTITVTDNVTGCEGIDTVLVIVPESAAAGDDFVVCDNGVVIIGQNSNIPGYSYTWEPVAADWRNGSTNTDATPEVFVATTQDFYLTVIDSSGTCTTKDTVTVSVESIPAPFTLPDLSFCPSQTDPLVLGTDDGTSGGNNLIPAGYSYSWSPGTVSDAAIANPTVNSLPSNSFTYEITVQTPGGCNQIVTQTINPTVVAPIVVTNRSICIGESIPIGDASNPTGGTITYSWDPTTDLSDPTSPNPDFNPTSAGTFTFILTASDASTTPACEATASVTITVQELIAPTLTPQTICEGEAVVIGVTGNSALSYQWSPTTDLDDAYIANPTFAGTTSTNYILTIVNGNGCTAEVSTSITVNPPPAISSIDYPDQEFCDPSTPSTVLAGTITPSGNYGYSWTPTSFLNDPNAANPTLFLNGEGTYEYVLEIIDQATGCSVFDTMIVTVGSGCGTGVIGNLVWLDENGDGVQDAGEPGIAGVTVELKDGSGSVVATTTTDANGGYIFTDLPNDTYIVTVLSDLPTGAVPTYDENGGTDGTTIVIIADGEEHMTAEFGYNFTSPADTDTPTMAATGALGDQVWNDADGNGVQDPGESGIANVAVNLFSDPDGDGVYDTPAGTTTTDASGNYIFDGLAPNAYVVQVDDTTLPAGFTTTPTGDPDSDANNTSSPIVVAPGDVILTGDFGYNLPTGNTISDLVYVDADGDGIQDAGEPGIAGVSVALEDVAGNVIATTTTAADGTYSFPGLADGTYDVVITDTENILGELAPITDPDGGNDMTSSVTLAGVDNVTQDFGFAPAGHTAGDGMIGDVVYIDTNNDNLYAAGEGVENALVELYAADGTTLLSTTTTNENGSYLFGALDATVTYVVKVDETSLPGGDVYDNFSDPDGSAPADGTSVVDLATATDGIDFDQDFGYQATTPVSISGTVWEDTNGDGTFDGTEMDLFAGVTVSLTDVNGNVIATTTTDANGDYSFENIPADTYTLTVVEVNDALLGYWHSEGTDSEPTGTTVDASAGSVADVDFGYYTEGASLGNYVWNDTNGDGIQDVAEMGIEGVLVTLEIDYNGDGTPEITMVDTTDANGHYNFGNLLLDEDYVASGIVEYTISAAAPLGYAATTADASGNDLTDSDDTAGVLATVSQGASNTLTDADPTAEPTEASYDFGFKEVGTAVIGNTVWLDENGDGVQDAGEPGIANVVVELKDGSGNVVATTTTDANGGYIFRDLIGDSYTVTVLSGLPTGAVPTYDENGGTDEITTMTIANGDEYMTAEFGYNFTPTADTDSPTMTATGALGDQIWNDADGNGVRDSGESGIANVTVNLFSDPDGDGVYDTVAGTTTTDATGNYIFDGLVPAGYVVEVDDTTLPTGFTTTPTGDPDSDADNASSPIVVAPGDVVLIGDFGYNLPTGNTISDLVYVDADGDGVQDAAEAGIAGVSIALEDAAGNVIATTITAADGTYSFPGLADATYDVVITDTENVLGELAPITDPDGGNDMRSSVILAGADNTIQDFGFAPAGHTAGDGMIGDVVYIDTNNDNVYGPGEGVENVKVELYAANGTTLLSTTTTNENGSYLFGALDATATYVVKVDETSLPGGDVYDNFSDPDGSAPADGTSLVDLATATDGIDFDQDFGYQATTPVSISGTIWEDTNADGILDGTETDLFVGVSVSLTDANGNVIATTTTDANGDYSFENIPVGTYTVAVAEANDALLGYWHSEGTDSEPTATIVDTSAGSVADVDFGYYTEGASLGNYIWNDTNGDGTQDAGEMGMAGVEVTLAISYDGANAAEVTLVTTTDANGFYSFDNLLLDEDYAASGTVVYTISATAPMGYTATTADASGNDLTDSDDASGVVATATQGAITTTTNAVPTLETTEASYDFGFKSTNDIQPIDDDQHTLLNISVGGNILRNDFDPENNAISLTGFEVPGSPGTYINSGTLATVPGTDSDGNSVADAGDLMIQPNGSYTFTPTTGFTGMVEIPYEICDNGSPQACEMATLTIIVDPVPDPTDPTNNDIIANNDDNITYVNKAVSGDLLSNDSDPTDDVITFSGFDDGMGSSPVTFQNTGTLLDIAGKDENNNPVANAGDLTINTDGTYTFTPETDFIGKVEVPYEICDDGTPQACDIATLTIQVLPDANLTDNDAPFAGDDFSTTPINTAVTDVFIANDQDPNSNSVSLNGTTIDPAAVSPSSIGEFPTDQGGTIEFFENGEYLYTPPADYYGPDEFAYELCDVTATMPQPLCDSATINLTVMPVYRDFSDLLPVYGKASHQGGVDANSDNIPDGANAIWLGDIVDYETAEMNGTSAIGDDASASDDEDALTEPTNAVAGTNSDFIISLNGNTVGTTVHYGMWIDWDGNGTFETFYTGSEMINGATDATVSVAIPSDYTGTDAPLRIRAFSSAPSAADFEGDMRNGEVEDYVITAMILPVELTHFSGEANGCHTFLKWHSEVEENFSHYELERSGDGQLFRIIEELKGKGGLTSGIWYNYNDKSASDHNYYRLKMVDQDGSFEYSKVIYVSTDCDNDNKLIIYPNPTRRNGAVDVKFYSESNEAHIKIVDMRGRIVKQLLLDVEPEFDNTIRLDISNLPSGSYMMHLVGERRSKMFIIQE